MKELDNRGLIDKYLEEFFDTCTECVNRKTPDLYYPKALTPIFKEYLIEKMGYVNIRDEELEAMIRTFRRLRLKEFKCAFLNINSLGKEYEKKSNYMKQLKEDLNKMVLKQENTDNVEYNGKLGLSEEFDKELKEAIDKYNSKIEYEIEREISEMAEELDRMISEDLSLSSGKDIKDSNYDNQLNNIDYFAYIESNKEWIKNYLLGIDNYIKRIMSNLSFDKLIEGLIISVNQDYLINLEDKQKHAKALMNDLEMILIMLEDGSCFDDNNNLPLCIDIEDDMVEINSPKEKKKIERNGNPFRRGPRK